jgi:hypothetical protein
MSQHQHLCCSGTESTHYVGVDAKNYFSFSHDNQTNIDVFIGGINVKETLKVLVEKTKEQEKTIENLEGELSEAKAKIEMMLYYIGCPTECSEKCPEEGKGKTCYFGFYHPTSEEEQEQYDEKRAHELGCTTKELNHQTYHTIRENEDGSKVFLF